jgi:hypothetical protein
MPLPRASIRRGEIRRAPVPGKAGPVPRKANAGTARKRTPARRWASGCEIGEARNPWLADRCRPAVVHEGTPAPCRGHTGCTVITR